MDFDVAHPFTRARALAAGITDGQLRGPGFVQLFQGVHVAAGGVQIDLATRARGALVIHPESAVLAGSTAAVLLRLPARADPVVHVAVTSADDRRPRPGLASVVDPRRSDVTTVDGLPVTTGATLFLQLAVDLPLVELVVLGDAMVRRRMVTVEALKSRCASARGRGVRLARRAAALVRERVDSPMETRVRLLLVFAGFPEPLVNPEIAGRYRTDLVWAALRLVVEYDGRHHREDLDQWDHDIERNEWFETHDWLLVHAVARDIFQRPDEFLARVLSAWVRRGGATFAPRPDWMAHFPVRSDDRKLAE